MIRAAVRTYILNGSQILSMSVFSLIVPLTIGFEEYGRYVALFAIPGIAAAIIETFLVVNQNNYSYFFRFFFILLVIVFLSTYALFSVELMKVAGLMYFSLVIKSAAYSIVNRYSGKSFVEVLFYSELSVMISYLSSAFFCVLVSWKNYLMPLILLVLSSFVYALVVFIYDIRNKRYQYILIRNWVSNNENRPEGFIRLSFLRFYEDYHFTILPMLLGLYLSLKVAGEYKFFMSIVKLGIKVYPVRYETIKLISDFKRKHFRILLIVSFIISFFIFLFLFLLMGNSLVFNITGVYIGHMSLLISSVPFFGFLLAALPHQIANSDKVILYLSLFLSLLVTSLGVVADDYISLIVLLSSAVLFLFSSYRFIMNP